MISFEVVSDRDELARRAPMWGALCDAEGTSCFARPEWVLPYVSSFEASAKVVFAYDGVDLIGVFSCREGRQRLGRTLSTLGGEHVPELALALSRDPERLVSAFVRWTLGRGYAELRLPRISRDSPLYAALGRTFGEDRRMVYERVDRYQHHTRAIGGFSSFVRGQSKNFKKQVHRAERAARDLELTVEVHADADAIERSLPELARVSGASWQGRAGTGTFSNATYRRCYANAAIGLARAGRVRLMVCRRQEVAVGFILHFVERDRLVALKSEFDEAEEACMTGWQIAPVAVDHAHALGLGVVTSGSFVTDFKERWTTHRSQCADLIVFAPTVAGGLSFAFPHLAKELVKRACGRTSVARCLPLLDFNLDFSGELPASEARHEER